MNKLNLAKIAKGTQQAMKKHSPEILTGIGIAGMITAAVMAVRATPKALALIDEATVEYASDGRTNHGDIQGLPKILSAKETIRLTWKCYVPATITAAMSTACLIGASSANVRRNTALATAYTLSESALKAYKGKVIETIGEKKEQSVRDAIAKDKIDQNPVCSTEVILTEKGNTLCYDAISGRYFKSDIEKIKKAVNEINRNMLDDMFVSLNDFYYEVGLDGTKIGEELGWDINKGLVKVNFSSQLATDGTPCLVMDYAVAPRYDYYM